MYEETQQKAVASGLMGQGAQALGQVTKMANRDACDGRPSGKDTLRRIARNLRRRADNLEALCAMTPENPTPEQDQHLWELANGLSS